MQALLATIVIWLSVNFGLPATGPVPSIRFVSAMELAFLHYEAFTPAAQAKVVAMYAAQPAGSEREVLSVYDALDDTILLPNGWTGETPAEMSMLVHEMVHHLQAVAGTHYACPEEREELAYAAQEKWLSQSGTTLEREFGIDAMTLLVTTHCIF